MPGVFSICTKEVLKQILALMYERKKKMTKKSIIISVISAICLVGIVSFAMYGCSSKGGNEKKEKTGVSGQITVISREEGSGTREAFVELMGVTDENGNDITADSAELTNSTSVVMSTVRVIKTQSAMYL